MLFVLTRDAVIQGTTYKKGGVFEVDNIQIGLFDRLISMKIIEESKITIEPYINNKNLKKDKVKEGK